MANLARLQNQLPPKKTAVAPLGRSLGKSEAGAIANKGNVCAKAQLSS
jgi:hypothetical protein